MGNCLVTKLKESVNNDNLELLGKIVIPFVSSNKLTFMDLRGTGKIAIKGNGNFYYYNQSTPLSNPLVLTNGESNAGYDVSGQNTNTVLIVDKYKITHIWVQTPNVLGEVNVNDFAYSPDIITLVVPCKTINIDNLNVFPKVTRFGDILGGLQGDIANLALKFPLITNLSFSNSSTNITGDLKNFISNIVSNRPVGSIIINVLPWTAPMTFWGVKPQSNGTLVNSTIHWESAEKNYVVNNNSAVKKIFAHGYTSSEMDELVSSGTYAGYTYQIIED